MTQPVMKVWLAYGMWPPAYAKPGDSGLDLRAPHDLFLKPYQRQLIDTGVHIELPAGYEATIRPRSSGSVRGVTAAFGTIDNAYRGSLGVVLRFEPDIILRPDGTVGFSAAEYRVAAGDKIAQLVVSPVAYVKVEEVAHKELLTSTERGEGGFGSTGR